jgi:regulator of cell morphogenesis and NO signaling
MITKSTSIKEIVSGNKILESVIDRFGFERSIYHQPLIKVCNQHGADPEFVIQVIKAFSDNFPFPNQELLLFPITLIIDYLKKTHTYYLDKKIPEIELSFTTLSRDYAYSHPQLLVLAKLFMEYKKELVEHIDYEEYVLFPYILELTKVKEQGKSLTGFGLDKYSIAHFNEEHHHEEEILTKIRETIEARFKNIKTPLPFRIFLNQIAALENDLLTHSRIEDKILFPKALELEKELKTS